MTGNGFIGKNIAKIEVYIYTFFRILIGWLFFMHGTAKVFGWWGKDAAAGFMMTVGVFESLAGLFIILGLWTRLAAIVGSIIMISAWFKAHVPNGWNPFSNGGELALMFLAAFAFIIIYGAGKYGIEYCVSKKECI